MILKTLLIYGGVITMAAGMTLAERKVSAWIQWRIGPNRVGPWGTLQPLADGVKFIFKEELMPAGANPLLFRLAPMLAAAPAMMAIAVIPFAGDITLFGVHTTLSIADIPISALYVVAVSGLGIYGIILGGWSSNSKYSLMGALRASAQMVSYEAALGLSVATVILVAGTLSTNGIVAAQATMRDWNIVATGVLPFVVFVIAVTAELNRPPFDLVEAEQELVGGFNTEYSSIGFALFYLAEFMNTVTMSAVFVTLFLGGPQPLFGIDLPVIPGAIQGVIWFFLKLLLFLFMYVWFRATLPRFRYDQLMDLGWKVLIPVAFGWFLFLTTLRVTRDIGWTRSGQFLAGAAAVLVAVGAYALLTAALRVSTRQRETHGSVF
jgi:NADH-quinone oxidoreductase subunit H